MPFLETGGAKIYYETHGEGPAIVFAHGAGGSHISWWQQVPAFRDHYTCVTFDHRGFGQSLDPRPVAERPRFDEDMAAIIDHLGLDRVFLVAQSMGGWTCLSYAVNNPGHVAGVVMGDTSGGLTSPEIEAARQAGREAVAQRGLANAAVSDSYKERDPAGAFLYQQIFDLNPPRDPETNRAPMARLSVTAEQAGAIKVPFLFIEGEDDVIIPPPVIQAAVGMIPGARLEMVADAGHSVYFERPGAFNALVASFLEEHQ